MSEQDEEGLKTLRKVFDDNQISKLPKPYKADSPKGKCQECGGWHGLPAVHLDYVGHAALTDRLLDADPHWTWEPLAYTAEGLPLVDKDGGLWIKLTVCGMTRLGYGDAQGKTGSNAMKERIGDALRNAAMRFGAALDLWHKGDLHAAGNAEERVVHVKGASSKSNGNGADATGGDRGEYDPQTDPVHQAANAEQAKRDAAEEKKREEEAITAAFTARMDSLSYTGKKSDLAKALSGKDKPTFADMKAALEMSNDAWNAAIMLLYAPTAEPAVAETTLTETEIKANENLERELATAGQSKATLGAMSR